MLRRRNCPPARSSDSLRTIIQRLCGADRRRRRRFYVLTAGDVARGFAAREMIDGFQSVCRERRRRRGRRLTGGWPLIHRPPGASAVVARMNFRVACHRSESHAGPSRMIAASARPADTFFRYEFQQPSPRDLAAFQFALFKTPAYGLRPTRKSESLRQIRAKCLDSLRRRARTSSDRQPRPGLVRVKQTGVDECVSG